MINLERFRIVFLVTNNVDFLQGLMNGLHYLENISLNENGLLTLIVRELNTGGSCDLHTLATKVTSHQMRSDENYSLYSCEVFVLETFLKDASGKKGEDIAVQKLSCSSNFKLNIGWLETISFQQKQV